MQALRLRSVDKLLIANLFIVQMLAGPANRCWSFVERLVPSFLLYLLPLLESFDRFGILTVPGRSVVSILAKAKRAEDELAAHLAEMQAAACDPDDPRFTADSAAKALSSILGHQLGEKITLLLGII